MRIFFRGFARDVRNFFRPWQNMDEVRAEVKRARKNESFGHGRHLSTLPVISALGNNFSICSTYVSQLFPWR